jgi:hypothetical protein
LDNIEHPNAERDHEKSPNARRIFLGDFTNNADARVFERLAQ